MPARNTSGQKTMAPPTTAQAGTSVTQGTDSGSLQATNSPPSARAPAQNRTEQSPMSNCTSKWKVCANENSCCDGLIFGSHRKSGYMCVKPGEHVSPMGCTLEWHACSVGGNQSTLAASECCPGKVCTTFHGSPPMCLSKSSL